MYIQYIYIYCLLVVDLPDFQKQNGKQTCLTSFVGHCFTLRWPITEPSLDPFPRFCWEFCNMVEKGTRMRLLQTRYIIDITPVPT